MRFSTSLALRWEDLDLDTMEFVVTWRLSGDGAGVEIVPGVKRDRFGEDAPPLLDEVLAELRALQATFNPKQRASGLLFPTAAGGFRCRNSMRKPFLDICKEAGITKRFTPHGCRRTGAKLYGRTAGTRMAMDIAGHVTDAMHRHYTPLDAAEKAAAGRQAFAGLKLIEGGASCETGTQTVTPGDGEEKAAAKWLS